MPASIFDADLKPISYFGSCFSCFVQNCDAFTSMQIPILPSMEAFLIWLLIVSKYSSMFLALNTKFPSWPSYLSCNCLFMSSCNSTTSFMASKKLVAPTGAI